MNESPEADPPPHRGKGVTASERHLSRLATRSFLSLWSYTGVHRDQGGGPRSSNGKELCDLLVVFENDVLIFSDKEVVFGSGPNLDLDWCRWYRKAIARSAEQIWGAKRWLREHPDRLFLDARCTLPFPIEFPVGPGVRYHRIVVANGAASRCRQEFGGSGSLIIRPDFVGLDHCKARSEGGMPFAVGTIASGKGFVHVLNEESLAILLRELDTITDFVRYLTKKEELVTNPRFGGAAGEEELLGAYLGDVDERFDHCFVLPSGGETVYFVEGTWDAFAGSADRRARIEADGVSYLWDNLIEETSAHVLAGSQYYTTNATVGDSKRGLRFLAREPRTRRRMLARGLRDRVLSAPQGSWRTSLIVEPSKPGDPHYVFMTLGCPEFLSYEQYREFRRQMLEQCCRAVRLKYDQARDVVGIATEPGDCERRSTDLVHYDARHFSEKDRREAMEFANEARFMKNARRWTGTEYEYPPSQQPTNSRKGRLRNKQCACGSGRKWKHCCGVAQK